MLSPRYFLLGGIAPLNPTIEATGSHSQLPAHMEMKRPMAKI